MATLSEELDLRAVVAVVGLSLVLGLLVETNSRLDNIVAELQQMREMAQTNAMRELEVEVED